MSKKKTLSKELQDAVEKFNKAIKKVRKEDKDTVPALSFERLVR